MPELCVYFGCKFIAEKIAKKFPRKAFFPGSQWIGTEFHVYDIRKFKNKQISIMTQSAQFPGLEYNRKLMACNLNEATE